MTTLHLIVHGRVHGVFYRNWTVSTARKIGLSGWVRNCPDGTVEALVQGEDAPVAEMIEAMHSGPPAARVDRIEQTPVAPQEHEGFERR